MRAAQLVNRLMPEAVKRPARAVMFRDATIAQGWDRWARFQSLDAGDDWSDPQKIGIDVPADQIVTHLDDTVFAPFLGECDVLLEIGPGAGRFTTVLLPKCRRLIAVDTSKNMLRLLRKRFPDDARLEAVLVDGRELPAEDGAVDCLFSYGVFVHLSHYDIFNYLLEAKRVLRSGGRAILQHANTFSDLGWGKFVRDVHASAGRSRPFGTFAPMTPEMFAELVSRAGLEVVQQRTDVARRDCITLIQG